MIKNLNKKEIRKASTFELTIRFNRLMLKGELLSAHEITVDDARETLYIEDELRRRLVKVIGRDFYPPDCEEKEAPSNYMISIMKRDKVKPKVKPDTKIKFKITIMSSIGSVVAEKNVSVATRGEADLLAGKLIRDLGIKRATYKLS